MPFYLLSVLSFIVTMMLQLGIFSRINLLSGSADLMLLFVAAWSLHQDHKRSWILVLIFGLILSSITAAPFFIPLMTYLLIFLAAKLLHLHIWRTPILSMFLLTFFGTLIEHGLYFVSLFIQGIGFSISSAFAKVLLPSVLLNMLLAIPIHALVQDAFRNEIPVGSEI